MTRPRAQFLAQTLASAGLLMTLGCQGTLKQEIGECTDPNEVLLNCPQELLFECVEPGAQALDFTPEAKSCDGSAVAVVCDPAPGTQVTSALTEATCTAQAGDRRRSCTVAVRVTEAGSAALVCASAVEATCDGPLTAVPLTAPEVVETCGRITGAVTDDAPAAGFPPGESTVRFSAPGDNGASVECLTQVTVLDTAPPTIVCQPNLRLVRAREGDVLTPPTLEGTDNCAPPAPAVPSVEQIEASMMLTYTAVDAVGNEGTCETEVTVVEAYQAEGVRVLGARLTADGTDAVIGWDPGGGVDATGYAIERAMSEAGPFERIGDVGMTTRTFVDRGLTGDARYYRVVTLTGAEDGSISDNVRLFPLSGDQYGVGGQSVPTLPFQTDLVGYVRRPSTLSAGPFPVAILLHGNHGNCRRVGTTEDGCDTRTTNECVEPGFETTPNAQGLSYLASTLAAKGFVATTISANALNCRNDFIEQRAQLIVRHLELWKQAADSGGPLGDAYRGNLDLTKVALFGHSRGAEAVAHVPRVLRESPRAGIALSSVFSLAPTDFQMPAPAGVPYAVLLPGCDGDVRDLAGMRIYDRAIASADGSPNAQFLFPQTNHNYFSTEWTGDDSQNMPGAVCDSGIVHEGQSHRGLLEAVVSSWADGHASGSGAESFAMASGGVPESISTWAGAPLGLRRSYSQSRGFIDDFAGEGNPNRNRLGGENQYTGFSAGSSCGQGVCDARYGHLRRGVVLSWDAMATASFALGDLDASDRTHLGFRAATTNAPANTGSSMFRILVTDSAGEVATAQVSNFAHSYPANAPFVVLSSVRVPLDLLRRQNPEFDVTQLGSVAVEFAEGTAGQIVIADLAVD